MVSQEKNTYMRVSLSIVSNKGEPPEVVEATCTAENVGIVSLVVVSDPCSDESPHTLPGWVSSQS